MVHQVGPPTTKAPLILYGLAPSSSYVVTPTVVNIVDALAAGDFFHAGS